MNANGCQRCPQLHCVLPLGLGMAAPPQPLPVLQVSLEWRADTKLSAYSLPITGGTFLAGRHITCYRIRAPEGGLQPWFPTTPTFCWATWLTPCRLCGFVNWFVLAQALHIKCYQPKTGKQLCGQHHNFESWLSFIHQTLCWNPSRWWGCILPGIGG